MEKANAFTPQVGGLMQGLAPPMAEPTTVEDAPTIASPEDTTTEDLAGEGQRVTGTDGDGDVIREKETATQGEVVGADEGELTERVEVATRGGQSRATGVIERAAREEEAARAERPRAGEVQLASALREDASEGIRT